MAEIKARAAADKQEAASQVVEASKLHDANPWLRMTRWARYLAEEMQDPVGRATRAI
ncbi:uncharacterized protein BDV17DRAFT_296848 [Aspergillus undulatus]|uniref:uncharacterized protein n=1 Tax=Aspergillus undulatus TaxID=1810928 RepID=UPI003CCE1BDA